MDGDGDATVAALRSLGATNLTSHRGRLNHLVRFELDRSRLAEAAALADVAWIEPTAGVLVQQRQGAVGGAVRRPELPPRHRPRHPRAGSGRDDQRQRHPHEPRDVQRLDAGDHRLGRLPDPPQGHRLQAGLELVAIAFGDDVDFDYHGTHTSGTVAGNPDPFSTAPWSGMAKDARLYFMDVAGTDGGVCQLPDDLNDLFQPSYTGNMGGAARISSNSWGSSSRRATTRWPPCRPTSSCGATPTT